MYSVILKTQAIADKLQTAMNAVTLRWKNSDDTEVYGEAKPKVYAFTFDDLNGDFPLKTPSILVQLMSVDDNGVCSYIIYCCVCNPALQAKEMTYPVEGSENTYHYGDSTFPDDDEDETNNVSIDSACVRSDLYKACLMLAEQVYIAIKKMSNDDESIHDVILETPSPYMENFPYCEALVKFQSNLSIVNTKINTSLWDML